MELVNKCLHTKETRKCLTVLQLCSNHTTSATARTSWPGHFLVDQQCPLYSLDKLPCVQKKSDTTARKRTYYNWLPRSEEYRFWYILFISGLAVLNFFLFRWHFGKKLVRHSYNGLRISRPYCVPYKKCCSATDICKLADMRVKKTVIVFLLVIAICWNTFLSLARSWVNVVN